jgi:hypothetical protein
MTDGFPMCIKVKQFWHRLFFDFKALKFGKPHGTSLNFFGASVHMCGPRGVVFPTSLFQFFVLENKGQFQFF